MKDVVVWRSSVIDGAFICRCGADLLAKGAMKGIIETHLITGQDREYVVCKKCGHVLAEIDKANLPEKIDAGNFGTYIEFERRSKA